MKKKELLIILLLAVLLTITTFHWWNLGVMWDLYLAPGMRCYPWPLTPLSYYQWWFPLHVFIFWFVALGGSWQTLAGFRIKDTKLKIGSTVLLVGIMVLTILVIRRQIPADDFLFWSLVLAGGWWAVQKIKSKKIKY